MTTNTMDSTATNAAFPGGELYVSPTCFIQTAENRFGPAVLDDLKMFVHGTPEELDVPIDEESGNDDEYDDEPLDQAASLAVNEWIPHLDTGFETDNAQHSFPRIAAMRNNLTALSQRYNLYFAVYQDRIYVYQPRRASPHILPSPTLILHPQPSKWAARCPPALDHRFPHQVNHIIVGNLGNLEIVLLGYDDGDTIAYYTHSIVHYIKQSSSRTRSPGRSSISQGTYPKPFFHDNVGESAWGLAVHEKSRLIAVSSNLHEVTVFAFALVQRNGHPLRHTKNRCTPIHAGCSHPAAGFQKDFRSRSRGWRIVLPLTLEGSNIPNVSFLDDEMGDAEKVVARDISGSVWFLDIWRLGVPHLRWRDTCRRPHMPTVPRGWGVLVLPYSSFRPAKSIRETLGVPRNEVFAAKKETHNRICLDTTCSLYYIKGFAPNPDTLFQLRHARLHYSKRHMESVASQEDEPLEGGWESGSESELDAEEGAQTTSRHALSGHIAVAPLIPMHDLTATVVGCCNRWPEKSHHKGTSEFQLAQWIMPASCEAFILGDDPNQRVNFNRICMERKRKIKVIDYEDLSRPLTKTHSLLRTSTGDLELQPFDLASPSIECNYLLTEQCHPAASTQSWDLHPVYSERISMLQHVPELSLVIAGSPTGRVALITLTKGPRRANMSNLRYGFRVEYILPRKNEEALATVGVGGFGGQRPIQPMCTLIGVAIGPAPRQPRRGGLRLSPKTGAEGKALPATYRLILHYKDHTILMYDIRREEEELLVF